MKPQKVLLDTIFLCSAMGWGEVRRLSWVYIIYSNKVKWSRMHLIYPRKSPCMFSESHYIPQIPRLFRKRTRSIYIKLSWQIFFFRNCYVRLTLSLKLLWATIYTFDNKNNLNYHDIMKLALCQKRRVINKLFLCLLLPYLCNYIFLNEIILKKVFFFSFSFSYFRFWVGARDNVSL